MKEEKYEITLLKANGPHKNHTRFSTEALTSAIESYNKSHENSRLFLQPDGSLAMSVYSWGEILEDGTIVERKN